MGLDHNSHHRSHPRRIVPMIYHPSDDGASTANITFVLNTATSAQCNVGVAWYDVARNVAEAIGAGNAIIGAGILAALSPQITWPECQALARANTSGRRFRRRGHFKLNLSKAAEIWSGRDPWDVLHGPKERAFACNIAHGIACPHRIDERGVGGWGSCVTIDRHALAVAYGRVLTQRGVRTYLNRTYTYPDVADMYREAAKNAHLPVHVLQAITWVTWKESRP